MNPGTDANIKITLLSRSRSETQIRRRLNSRTGLLPISVSKINGDFGEALVTYLIASKGVEVLHGPTVGFDLFAIDRKGAVFPRRKRLIGISVKTRLLVGNYGYSNTIPTDEVLVRKVAKTWRAEPWLAVVAGSLGHTLEVLLVPYNECEQFRGRAITREKVSVSALERDKSGTVKTLFREDR